MRETLTRPQTEWTTCLECHGSGRCQHCHGMGHEGRAICLVEYGSTGKGARCPYCARPASGDCLNCGGLGMVIRVAPVGSS